MAAFTSLGMASNPCECRSWVPNARLATGISKVAAIERSNFHRSLRPCELAARYVGQTFGIISKRISSAALPRFFIQMSLVDDKVFQQNVADKSAVLTYELIQGSLVRWNSVVDKSVPDPPTAVFIHGILGCRKNWGSFARRLSQEFPMWQFLLVDLRCHADSASIKKRGPHSVASAALDVLQLVRQLRIIPRVLVGHSFGGKVALSMVDQAAKPLARPLRVWILDATPGKVRPGGDGNDHPGELIAFLQRLPKKISSKQEVVSAIVQQGFSRDVAQWVATNLRPIGNSNSRPLGFSWNFDLNGIADMYTSYETTNIWGIVENVPRGVHMNFLKAERSLHRWALEDLQRIHAAEELASDEGAGVQMHVLEDAGHWVHADNPDGLFKILSKSFKCTVAANKVLRGLRPQ
ncbi:protein ABHD11 isoform X2 [Phalaenopsis equestris]|uniref:protein ABHD11 isoform X2 n=1 Tax=Phalaenopsis equestris TaxID=78828 RepID=UPI0009E18C4C|nr:protein ABHD11 isoform X2 [Phalaenopsis equestris]